MVEFAPIVAFAQNERSFQLFRIFLNVSTRIRFIGEDAVRTKKDIVVFDRHVI
jgi:hypothetical protein